MSCSEKILTTEKHNSENNVDYLFQIKPFDTYDYFYNPLLSTQAWLINHETFINKDTIVNSGIALDYNKQRITFYTFPIVNNRFSFNKKKISPKGFFKSETEQSFFKSYYKGKKYKEPQILKTDINFEINDVDESIELLYYTSTSDIDSELSSLTLSRDDFNSFINESLLNNFDSFLSPIYLKIVKENDENITGNDYYPLYGFIYKIVLTGYDSYFNYIEEDILLPLFSYYTNQFLITSQQSSSIENITSTSNILGRFYFQKSNIEDYININFIDNENIESLISKERTDIINALNDIRLYHNVFFCKLQTLLTSGIDVFPHGVKTKYYPKIVIKFEKIETSASFSLHDSTNYELDENNHSSALSIKLDDTKEIRNIKRKTEPEEIVSFETYKNVFNYIDLCIDDDDESNKCLKINGKEIESLDVEWINYNDKDKVENKDKKCWSPLLKYYNSSDAINYEKPTIEKAFELGKALLKEELIVKISNKQRCEALNRSDNQYLDDLKIAGYSQRRFFCASILIHELAHVYERVNNMVEDFLWSKFIDTLPNEDVIIYYYPNYRNVNIYGHVLGRPTATFAIKTQIEFEKEWQTKMVKKVLEKNNTLKPTDSQILNVSILKEGIGTNEEDFRKNYSFNRNGLKYTRK